MLKAPCAIIVVLLAGLEASAFELQRTDHYLLDTNGLVGEQLCVAAETADVKGTVEDDTFVAAQSATLSGRFLNDVWVAGKTVNISGDVNDHLRVAADTFQFSGHVSNSLSAAASTVQIASHAHVDGSVNIAADAAILEGDVGGNARLVADRVTISGRIGGTARILASDIVVMPGTVIEGDLVYTSGKELILDDKIQLHGKLIRREYAPATPVSPMYIAAMQSFLLAAALLVGIPTVVLFPRYMGRAVRSIRQATWRCALVGAVFLCLVPMIALLLFVTVVGMPLAALMIFAYAILLYLCKIVVGLTLGSAILRWRGPQSLGRVIGALIVGLVFVYAMAMLPVVGMAASFLVVFLGLGGLILGLREPSKQELDSSARGDDAGPTPEPPLP